MSGVDTAALYTAEAFAVARSDTFEPKNCRGAKPEFGVFTKRGPGKADGQGVPLDGEPVADAVPVICSAPAVGVASAPVRATVVDPKTLDSGTGLGSGPMVVSTSGPDSACGPDFAVRPESAADVDSTPGLAPSPESGSVSDGMLVPGVRGTPHVGLWSPTAFTWDTGFASDAEFVSGTGLPPYPKLTSAAAAGLDACSTSGVGPVFRLAAEISVEVELGAGFGSAAKSAG
jgi:hypothetical protein